MCLFLFFCFQSLHIFMFDVCVHAKLLQSCPTLCDSMDCSPPGFSVCGILQAAILEWVVMPSSRGSSWPRNWTCISCVSCIAGRVFTTEPLGKQKEGDPACLKQSFLFMIFLFQLLSVFKNLVFVAALWCSFPFARCGAAWFMNHLDLHMPSVEFCLLTILDPADVSKIKMSGVTGMEMRAWLGHWSPKYVSC